MFRCDLLFELIEKSKVPRNTIAEALEMSPDSLRFIAEGRTSPGLEAIEKIADYFAVPIDVLLDRCTLEEEKSILKNYDKNFMILRRASYEAYMYGRIKPKTQLTEKYTAPYPYNIIEALMGHTVTRIIDDNIENRLMEIIDILPQRDREMLLMYFKDGELMDTIAQKYKISKGYVRQVIANDIKLLKHPSYICGIEGSVTVDFSDSEVKAMYEEKTKKILEQQTLICQQQRKLEKQQQEIEKQQQEIIELKARINNESVILQKQKKARENLNNLKGLIYPEKDCSISILDLSARTYNVLMRHFQKPDEYENSDEVTIQTLMDLIASKKLLLIHNLGKRSINEILSKLDIHFSAGTLFEDFFTESYKYLIPRQDTALIEMPV